MPWIIDAILTHLASLTTNRQNLHVQVNIPYPKKKCTAAQPINSVILQFWITENFKLVKYTSNKFYLKYMKINRPKFQDPSSDRNVNEMTIKLEQKLCSYQ